MGNVDSISPAAVDQIVNAIFGRNVPWVEPGTGVVGPEYHPTTSLGLTLSWVEEYTRRWAQEAQKQNQAALDAAVAKIIASGATGLTKEQIKEALAEAVAEKVQVTGDLEVNPR